MELSGLLDALKMMQANRLYGLDFKIDQLIKLITKVL